MAEATAESEAALRSNPADSRAHNTLGYILLARRKPAAAIKHFEAALRLNPQDAKARKNLEEAERTLRQQREP